MGIFCSRDRCTLSEAFQLCWAKQNDETTSGSEIQASALRLARKLLESNRGKRFGDAYVSLKTVSYGATSTVELVRSKSTGETLAAKIMPKVKSAYEQGRNAFHLRVLHEVAAMKIVESHPNAPRLLDVFEDDKCFYLVMDYYSGGELFEHIARRQKKGFTEQEAVAIMKDLMQFLSFCHSIGLVHADLKPENIVFSNADGQLKVLDFGMSVFCRAHESLRNVFGTINYCSPEMANKWCGQKTDVWSAGVLLYFMLSGHPPFAHKNKEAVLCRLRRYPTVAFNRPVWDDVSDEAKRFIRKLLSPCVDQRPTAKEALQLPWLSDPTFSTKSGFALDSETVVLLKKFSRRSMMKRVLWEQIARFVPEEHIAKQRKQFQSLDLDNNGAIDMYELKTAIGKVNPSLTEEELMNIFNALDVNQSGEIDLTEFIAATFMSLEPECRIKIARQSFMQVDKLGTGMVRKEDLRQYVIAEVSEDIRRRINLDELDTEISSMDLDGDGHISVEEFSSALSSL